MAIEQLRAVRAAITGFGLDGGDERAATMPDAVYDRVPARGRELSQTAGAFTSGTTSRMNRARLSPFGWSRNQSTNSVQPASR